MLAPTNFAKIRRYQNWGKPLAASDQAGRPKLMRAREAPPLNNLLKAKVRPELGDRREGLELSVTEGPQRAMLLTPVLNRVKHPR